MALQRVAPLNQWVSETAAVVTNMPIYQSSIDGSAVDQLQGDRGEMVGLSERTCCEENTSD